MPPNRPAIATGTSLVLPMIDNTIAAAKAVGARASFCPAPSTITAPTHFPLLGETSPQHPLTRKGAIRAEMEKRLWAAADNGAPVLIMRAGDFFGPRMTGNSNFSSAMIQQGGPVKRILEVADAGIGHAWAYLPDLAKPSPACWTAPTSSAVSTCFISLAITLATGEMAQSDPRRRPAIRASGSGRFLVAGPCVRSHSSGCSANSRRDALSLAHVDCACAGRRRKLAAFLGDALPAHAAGCGGARLADRARMPGGGERPRADAVLRHLKSTG